MIRSVIVIPSANSNKQNSSAGSSDDKSKSHSSTSRQSRPYDRGADRGSEGPKHHKRDVTGGEMDASSSHRQKNEEKRKGDHSAGKASTDRFTVMSIDHVTPLNWPGVSVKYTVSKPSISFSCEPSFCSHSINLSKEEEKRRKDSFVISDLLDDMVDYISNFDGKSHKDSKQGLKKTKKKKKVKCDAGNRATKDESGKKKKKKSVKERQRPSLVSQIVTVSPSSAVKTIPPASTSVPALSKDAEGKDSEVLTPFESLANGDNTKIEKKVKRLKHLKKKILSSSNDSSTVPPQVKKTKPSTQSGVKTAESTQKITIAFSQASGKLTTKSKWDTSSDEEGASRKGAISYRFSDESDTQQFADPVKQPEPVAAVPPRMAKHAPLAKMQPGGILQTIEIHNPLPDMKPAVPIAHPNPGPDGPTIKSPSRSRSRSHSRSRSRSRSYSYSTDGSYDRRRRGRSRRHRRSYTRSYSRSRSRSYSSSRSRSYSRSYSRSTSRSHSRYRSYSRSSYSSYSSRSYSSRSRSRSPRYTRAVQPKYNNTRAYNLGRRKNFKKKKNQYKSQQNHQIHQNPNIVKQLETGRMKAEETVMRLKKQKEQQEDLQKRAMESIAKAASSAGIPLPNTATSSSSPASTSQTTTAAAVPIKNEPMAETTASQATNGSTNNFLDSYREASQLAQTPAFVPRNFQNREFIGPIRPGMESDIPLPAGTPTSGSSKDGQQVDPLPMAAPNPDDETYKDLEAQAIQHVQGASVSPTTEQLQQLGVAHFQPQLQETTVFIDPMTGQPLQLAMHPQAIQQQQQMFLTQQVQLQQPAQSPQSADGDKQMGKDGKSTAPHEAVIESYAHQVFMSQQKALVSQSQSTFTIASSSTAVPQAGLPLQTTPMIITPAQLQMAQLQQAQAVQAAQVQAAAQAQQALQLHQLQQIHAASVGLNPQALALQPGLQQQWIAQQQIMQAQAAAAQGLAQPSVMQLPNGQLVVANPATQAMLLQRFARPM